MKPFLRALRIFLIIATAPYVIAFGNDVWTGLSYDQQSYVLVALFVVAVVLVFFRRWLRPLTAFALFPIGLAVTFWGFSELISIWSDRIAAIAMGLVTIGGFAMLHYSWSVLRPLFRRRTAPKRGTKAVAPPVVKPALNPQRWKVGSTLPDALADYLRSQ